MSCLKNQHLSPYFNGSHVVVVVFARCGANSNPRPAWRCAVALWCPALSSNMFQRLHEIHRKPIGKPWETHRKTMGNPWEYGGFMGFYMSLWDFIWVYDSLWDLSCGQRYKQLWKDPPFLLGQLTILTGPFSIAMWQVTRGYSSVDAEMSMRFPWPCTSNGYSTTCI